jgi:hypothetical protein
MTDRDLFFAADKKDTVKLDVCPFLFVKRGDLDRVILADPVLLSGNLNDGIHRRDPL